MIPEYDNKLNITDEGNISWQPGKINIPDILYSGRKITAEELYQLFAAQAAQGNALVTDLNKFFEAFPNVLDKRTNDINAEHEQMVAASVAKIVDGAPEQLNTLKEIANSLNNNANLASTLINEITTTKYDLSHRIDNLDSTKVTRIGNTAGDGQIIDSKITVKGTSGEAFRARRSAVFSGTTKTKRLYSGVKIDGTELLGHIQCTDETPGGDGVTGLIFRKDGLYQNLRGTETKLIQEDKGLVIPIPAPNFPTNAWAGLRLDNADANGVLQHRLWSGISDGTTVGQIEFYKRGAGTTALRFKPDGLYQKSGGVETKLATMADIANSGGGGGGGGSINFENYGTATLMRTWNNDYGIYNTSGYNIRTILPAGKYLILCDLGYSYYDGQENRVRGVTTAVVDLTGVIGNVDSFTAKFIGSIDYSDEGGNLEYYLTEVEFNVDYHSTMGTGVDIPNLIWDESWSNQQMEAMFTFIKIG